MPERIPHTFPSPMTFPQPLNDHGDPRLKHRLHSWDGGEADVVLVGMPFDGAPDRLFGWNPVDTVVTSD